MSRLKLRDGTSFAAPDFAGANEDSIGWKLRYRPDTLTHGEQMRAAEIISSYNYLFEPSMTAKAIGQKVAMMRRAQRERA